MMAPGYISKLPATAANQDRWAEGYHGGDNETDPAEREPSLGAPEPSIVAATFASGTEGKGGMCSVLRVDGQTHWAAGGTRDLENSNEDDEA